MNASAYPPADPPEPALLQTYGAFPFVLARAHGETLVAEDGREFVDFYGGHCVCGTGHGHPAVRAALHRQLDELVFYSTAARIHIRDRAAAALVAYAGSGMAAAFFCNSGSEANENALKLAVKQTGRRKFVAFRGAFHGRTLLALSVTDGASLRDPYAGLLAETQFLALNDRAALDAADFSEVAAVILEPIQSMAGICAAEADWLRALRVKCTAAGALLVFDEVQTGFGRLGAPFAAQYYGVQPDMLTCAKAAGSGFPIGVLLVSGAVAAGVKGGDLGSTFGGGPLACAALLATLEVVQQEDLAGRARAAEAFLRGHLAGQSWLQIRGAGLLLGLEAQASALAQPSPPAEAPVPLAASLKAHLLDHGLVVGGSSDPAVLRLMPPLTISDAALERLVAAIQAFGDAHNLNQSGEAA
jgi:acetylornithine/succinyldiaminopimelate/putrescine aminotransferase